MRKINLFKYAVIMFAALAVTFTACTEEDDPAEDPIASFQYAVSETNEMEVTFTNFSQNAVSYLWEFGDGETSVEESPVHVYADYGAYTVKLTATNADDVTSTKEESFELVDPGLATKMLHGDVSKDWRFIREGVSMGIGPDAENYTSWWSLENDGKRPCIYKQTWTFNADGSMTYDDGGMFWGEFGVFDDTDVFETCFEATAANMVLSDGTDVSAWLGGTHAFEYDPINGKLTLSGEGAWIGNPKVTPNGDVTEPQQSVEYDITITEGDVYDLMVISVDGGADFFWQFNYASYHNAADEPEVVEEQQAFGVDLDDVTPTEMFLTFASRDAADMAILDTITSGSSVVFGVEDPADATATVGEFTRTADVAYQELKFKTSPDLMDIQFDNFTKVKIDLYIPSSNDFAGTDLVNMFVLGFADESQTEEWWNDIVQFETTDMALDTWVTYEFDIADAKARTDLDMIFLGIGGSGHNAGGTFYVRNLTFE